MRNEGPIVEYSELSVLETVVTFFLVPTALFVAISVFAYVFTKPRKAKSSAITSID